MKLSKSNYNLHYFLKDTTYVKWSILIFKILVSKLKYSGAAEQFLDFNSSLIDDCLISPVLFVL